MSLKAILGSFPAGVPWSHASRSAWGEEAKASVSSESSRRQINEASESCLIHRRRKALCPAASGVRSITWRAVGQPDISGMQHSPPSIIQTILAAQLRLNRAEICPSAAGPHPQSWLLWHCSEPFVWLHRRTGDQGLGIGRHSVSRNGCSSPEGHIRYLPEGRTSSCKHHEK